MVKRRQLGIGRILSLCMILGIVMTTVTLVMSYRKSQSTKSYFDTPGIGVVDEMIANTKRKAAGPEYYAPELTEPLPWNATFVIDNPDICSSVPNLKYVVFVMSEAKRFQERHLLRHTYFTTDFLKSRHMRLVFMLGRPHGEEGPSQQARIQTENDLFGDIVQGSYKESRWNLSVKALLTMKWLAKHCTNVEFIIKIDDDVIVNVDEVLEELSKTKNVKLTFICHLVPDGPICRNKHDKRPGCIKFWMPAYILPGRKYYPKYCFGPLYAMTPDLPAVLYRAAPSLQYVWLDDAHVTGLVPEHIPGVKHIQKTTSWSHGHTASEIIQAWSKLQNNPKPNSTTS